MSFVSSDAEHLRGIDGAVAHHDRDFRRAGDDVRVGDDDAVRPHDEAGAEPGRRARLRRPKKKSNGSWRRLVDRFRLHRHDRRRDLRDRAVMAFLRLCET